jgi:hypothetical protein
MLTVNSFAKLNGVKSESLTDSKDLIALSINGLKMTSVRCPLNVNELKCLHNVNPYMGYTI